MKKSIIIVFSFLIFSCTPQECPVLSYDELNRIAYDSDNSPYTGRCSVYLNDKISSIQQYLNGKDYGRWTFYYPNGKIGQRQNLINLDKESVNGNITTKMEN